MCSKLVEAHEKKRKLVWDMKIYYFYEIFVNSRP